VYKCPVCHQPTFTLFDYYFRSAVGMQCRNCGTKIRARRGAINAVVALPFLLLIPIIRSGLSPDVVSSIWWVVACSAISISLAVLLTRLEPTT
jgi:hypothetical protein